MASRTVAAPPQVFVELRPTHEGCYVSARIEGVPERLPRTFVGVFGSRDEAVSEATSWAVGWLRRLRRVRREIENGEHGRAVR